MRLAIVFEDEHLVVISKPAGLTVEPLDRYPDQENALELLRAQLGRRSLILAHRLDRRTSGLLLFAKSRPVAGELSRAFEQRRVRKRYWAVTAGLWPKGLNRMESVIGRSPEGKLRSLAIGVAAQAESINGARALSTFRVLAISAGQSWLEVSPKTGRTHQIRLHCQAAGCPIVGDHRYNPVAAKIAVVHGHALHACRLDLEHPLSKAPLSLRDAPKNWRLDYLADFAAADVERIYQMTMGPPQG